MTDQIVDSRPDGPSCVEDIVNQDYLTVGNIHWNHCRIFLNLDIITKRLGVYFCDWNINILQLNQPLLNPVSQVNPTGLNASQNNLV